MDAGELGELEHANLVVTMALLCGFVDGALVRRRDGVALIATGLPLRLFNQVLIEDAYASPAAVEAAIAATRRRGDRFVLNLRRGTDDRFLPLVERLGLVALSPDPWLPGMALHPIAAPSSQPGDPGHEIRPATDAVGIEDHILTAAAGFGLPEPLLRSVVALDLLGRPGVTFYVGYSDGVPVSSGLGVRTGRTMGIYNIATVEGARKRGYGAAMTARIASDGAAAGCDVAALQASEMGRPIYERLGYRTVVEYMGYIDPEPSADGPAAG
jgi:hypothetical protein